MSEGSNGQSDGSDDTVMARFCCIGRCRQDGNNNQGQNPPEGEVLLDQPISTGVLDVTNTLVLPVHTAMDPDVNVPTCTLTDTGATQPPTTSTASDTAQASTSMDTSVEMQAPENDPSADQATPEMEQIEEESVE